MFLAGANFITKDDLPSIAAAIVGGFFALAANLFYLEMAEKINEHFPEKDRISWYAWGLEVRGKYKRLYPDGTLVRMADRCVIVMFICFIISMVLQWTGI